MEEEIDLKDIFVGLWNKKAIIVLVTIIFALIGIVYNQIANDVPEVFDGVTETYIATNTFKLGNKEKKVIVVESDSETTEDESETIAVLNTEGNGVSYVSDGSITVNETVLELYSEILKSTDTLYTINETYSLNISIDDWRELVSISQVSETELLSIRFEYIDEEIAISVVNDLTDILEDYIVDMYSSYNVYPITIVDSTKIDTSKTAESLLDETDVIKAIAIFAVIGFIGSCVVIVIIDLLRDNVKNAKQLEKTLNIKNLADISKNEDYVEKIKMLRINTENCKSIFITTPINNCEKNEIGIDLAKAFAGLDNKVIYLDFNNENVSLIKNYNKKGLVDYLNSNDKFVEKYANNTEIKNLNILTLGNKQDNITELLESPKMKEAIDTLERLFDIVIINTSNILNSANTLAVSKVSKNAILLVRNKKECLENVKDAKKNIEDIGGNVIGTVLIK